MEDDSRLAWTDPTCPVARATDLVGDRWSMLIIRDAMDGARTFTEFHQRTGIARNMLTDRLRRLTAYGLLAQVDAPRGKRKQYELTPMGEDLFPVILALRSWGERHAFAHGEQHSMLVDASGGAVSAPIPLGSDGARLTSRNTRVVKAVPDGGVSPADPREP